MRRISFLLCLLVICGISRAQSDSSAYNNQRNIVNRLLQERSSKFSQYDNSLTQRSGIFGLKTKKDLQASNDILTQIVLTDNNIFEELKILLDYKDFEKKEVEHRAETVEGRIGRFQNTITRLQQENDKLKSESEAEAKHADTLLTYAVLSTLAFLIAMICVLRQKKLRKTDN